MTNHSLGSRFVIAALPFFVYAWRAGAEVVWWPIGENQPGFRRTAANGRGTGLERRIEVS